MSYSIPGGKSKGTPIGAADTRDIEYWLKRLQSDLDAKPDKPYADRDRGWIVAASAELARREAGGAVESAPATEVHRAAPQLALARRESNDLAAGYREASEATTALKMAANVGHLVTPATSVAELPAGTVLALSQVVVAVDEETYALPGGKRGLSKVALDKIAAAAGVSWEPERCGRLDDGSHPHYCHYRAVGYYRAFDGAEITVSGEVELDARDGGPLVTEMIEKAAKPDRNGNTRDPNVQIMELRKFLLRHAESKAKNRAIRELGVRTSYSTDELQKPFLVAKVMFTGHSEDPATRAQFAALTAQAFLGGRRALYPSDRRQLAMKQPINRALATTNGHEPPPVGDVDHYPSADEMEELW